MKEEIIKAFRLRFGYLCFNDNGEILLENLESFWLQKLEEEREETRESFEKCVRILEKANDYTEHDAMTVKVIRKWLFGKELIKKDNGGEK